MAVDPNVPNRVTVRLETLLSLPLRLRQIYIATTIAEQGSLRDASNALYLTQPAASRSLRELEEVLQSKLFDRTAHGMVPTAAGQELLPHLRLIVSEVSALVRHADELRTGERGEVRVGTVLAGSARVLPDAVLEVTREAPDIRVRITEATPVALSDQLLNGELDLIVGRTQPIASVPAVDVEVLHDDEVTVVCAAGHPLAGCGELADLVDQAWVLPPTETSLRQQVDSAFVRAAGRIPADVVECVAPLPLRRMLTHGHRFGAVPARVFSDDLERGDLVPLPITIDGTSVPVGIITRKGGELPTSARRLIEALRTASRRLVEGP